MSARVVIVDDNQVMRTGVRLLLARLNCVEIVGEAENGEAAVGLARERRPDLIIMDVEMPALDGLSATRLIKEAVPETRVIVLTAEQRPTIEEEAREAGAAGLVAKWNCVARLPEALFALLEGRSYFGRLAVFVAAAWATSPA